MFLRPGLNYLLRLFKWIIFTFTHVAVATTLWCFSFPVLSLYIISSSHAIAADPVVRFFAWPFTLNPSTSPGASPRRQQKLQWVHPPWNHAGCRLRYARGQGALPRGSVVSVSSKKRSYLCNLWCLCIHHNKRQYYFMFFLTAMTSLMYVFSVCIGA